eukprot:scaffold228_cov312-Pinguiococcus_pyrenoidosus.AAC.21
MYSRTAQKRRGLSAHFGGKSGEMHEKSAVQANVYFKKSPLATAAAMLWLLRQCRCFENI